VGRSADIPRASTPLDALGDDTGCTVLHVDMDAFFASVEIRRRPELAGRPVVVGGVVRGVVAAASYEARRFGVRSAMPMSQALRLCPHAVVLPPDRAAYSAASAQVMTILRSVSPLVEPMSLDEAYIDVAAARRLLGRPAEIAQHLRREVAAQLGLTCSVGVATTKFIAKLASARCKPDGLLVVPAATTLQFLHPLPVTVLAGVGRRTAEPLHRVGVRTVGDLAVTPLDVLHRAVGIAAGEHLAALAAGLDPRPVAAADSEKSISSDRTADTDLTELEQITSELHALSGEVSRRLRSRDLIAKTVGIKIRFADFRTVTRSRTLSGWSDSAAELHRVALELYLGLGLDRPRIRLVGVKAERLRARSDTPMQLSFDAPSAPAALERLADHVKARFGAAAVGFAAHLGEQVARSPVPERPM
jgi:DNA polymerase IV